MIDKKWDEMMKDEDRIIANSDRKYRRHNNSLEAMSEELAYGESSERRQNYDIVENIAATSFIESIENEKLIGALGKLTAKQYRVVELIFFSEYKIKEIASMSGCTARNVSLHLEKALGVLRWEMSEN